MLATQWLSAILGGLAVATMDRFLNEWIQAMQTSGPHLPENLVAAFAGAGTLWLWIVPDGGTFLFAQVVGLQPPMLVRDAVGDLTFPFVASNPEGMGLLLVTPALAALALDPGSYQPARHSLPFRARRLSAV